MAKMGEMGTPVPPGTPRGHGGTPEFQALANQYLKECFDFDPDDDKQAQYIHPGDPWPEGLEINIWIKDDETPSGED